MLASKHLQNITRHSATSHASFLTATGACELKMCVKTRRFGRWNLSRVRVKIHFATNFSPTLINNSSSSSSVASQPSRTLKLSGRCSAARLEVYHRPVRRRRRVAVVHHELLAFGSATRKGVTSGASWLTGHVRQPSQPKRNTQHVPPLSPSPPQWYTRIRSAFRRAQWLVGWLASVQISERGFASAECLADTWLIREGNAWRVRVCFVSEPGLWQNTKFL